MMPEFTNDKVLDYNLPKFEEVELTPVSRTYLQVVILNTTIFSLIVIGAAVTGYFFLKNAMPDLAWILPAVITGLILINFIYQILAFRQRKYAFRDRDVIYQFGLISKSIIIIPFNRIQHTALEEGWLSRSLGLKSLTVFTAGAGGSDLSINGLPKDIAESFNQLILTKIDSEKASSGSLTQDDLEEVNQVNTPGVATLDNSHHDGHGI